MKVNKVEIKQYYDLVEIESISVEEYNKLQKLLPGQRVSVGANCYTIKNPITGKTYKLYPNSVILFKENDVEVFNDIKDFYKKYNYSVSFV